MKPDNNTKKYKLLKKLFLIDGIGAIISALLLGVVLVQFQIYIGIPKPTLYFLAALPCLFALYDFYCFFKINVNLGQHLRRIAIVNLLYCCLSLGSAIYHYSEITYLGWIYILVEILIVTSLAIVELKASKR